MHTMGIICATPILLLAQPAPGGDAPDRGVVVAALRYQEGLVKTLEAHYEYTMHPTSAEQRRLIEQALGKQAERSIFSTEFADYYTGTAQFWWKGAQRRKEWSSRDPKRRSGRSAYDGQVNRLITDQPDGPPVAVIAAPNPPYWEQKPGEDLPKRSGSPKRSTT